jgi:hypothetical protein
VQPGTAFTRCGRRDLERVFSLQFERTVNRDNTVAWQNLSLQIERVSWRATLAGANVTVHQHLDGTLSISYGPHSLGKYTAAGEPIKPSSVPRGVQKTAAAPPWKTPSVSHFPTPAAAAGH